MFWRDNGFGEEKTVQTSAGGLLRQGNEPTEGAHGEQ